MPRRRRTAGCGLLCTLIAALLGAMALPAGVHADGQAKQAPPPQDDADLMEFLGGIGSADGRWIDYLKSTDPTKVASPPKQSPPSGDSSASDSDGGQKK